MNAKRALARMRAPDEPAAEDRAWPVVRSAYRESLPATRPALRWRAATALAVALILAAAALSPAGATVTRLINRALGVHHAAAALFSLPAPGRILVSGPGGSWTVAADGSTRRLGSWDQASWSPHGLYIAVGSRNVLTAVAPQGTPHWSLARRDLADPRWYTPSGYRVAYLSRHELRVVAGDGTADRPLSGGVARVAPAWRTGHAYQLAYMTRGGRLVIRDADTQRVLWSARPGPGVHALQWSDDGRSLLVVESRAVQLFGADGRLVSTVRPAGGRAVIDAALSPDGRSLAMIVSGLSRDVVVDRLGATGSAPRRVFSEPGLAQVAWSPSSGWLLVTWPAANQWVFVRVAGAPRIQAVDRIAQRLSRPGRPRFPEVDGWCCTAGGSSG